MIRVVAGAIVRHGRLLAARRGPGMHHEGLWELPGGKVEPGEGDEAALVRELHEELGVTVSIGEWLGTSRTERIELVAWHCTLVRGEPAPSEHSELRWVAADELETLHWAPADVPLLAAVERVLGHP